MFPSKNVQPARGGLIVASAQRLVFAALALCIFAVPSAFGQTATYSDAWVVDTSPETYNAEEDAYSVTDSQTYVAGAGVTEPDYTSDSQSVETRLVAPDGATATATAYDYNWYSRAETTLPYVADVDAPPGNEAQYSVETVHTYQREYYEDPCAQPQDPRMEQRPCLQQVSYGPARRQWYYYPIIVVTRFYLTISIRITSYRISSARPSSCRYSIDCPEGYTCGYRSMWYYPHPGGAPCGPYLIVANMLINRRYCINSVYAKFSPVPVGCT